MAKRTILIAVVAFLTLSSIALATSWFDFYYSFGVQYPSNSGANTSPTEGNWDSGLYNTKVGGGDFANSTIFVTANPLDDACVATFATQSVLQAQMAVAGFSYNHNVASGMTIDQWLASAKKTLLYSTTQNIGPYSVSGGYPGRNDSIIAITNGSNSLGSGTNIQWSHEALITHMMPLVQAPYDGQTPGPYGYQIPGNTFGLQDLSKSGQGRTTSGVNETLADFQATTVAPDNNQRFYWTPSNTVVFVGSPGVPQIAMTRPNVVYHLTTGPVAGQYRGSGYNDTALAGDVLTCVSQNYIPAYGIFEYAWKIAGTMLGDKFWTQTTKIGTITYTLVWNNYKGYVSTSTATTAAEVTGHDALKNFLYYIFAITAVKVQDMDGDGAFDVGSDKIMFTLAPDSNNSNNYAYSWNNGAYGSWVAPWRLAGKFFPGGLGNAIYIYDGISVTTYMGKDVNLFFGLNQTTSAATIWAGKYGNYYISGFDITTFVPEPSTMILLIGSGLALGAGILRRRMR